MSNLLLEHRAYGFEIYRNGDATWLVDRRTWAMGILMAFLAGILVVLLAVITTSLSIDSPRATAATLAALFTGGLLLFVLFPIAMRAYRRRRDLPIAEVTDVLLIERDMRVLRTRDGEIISPLADVTAAARIAWWDGSRGMMRNVVLSWRGGRRVVFKTASRKKARAIAADINSRLGGQ